MRERKRPGRQAVLDIRSAHEAGQTDLEELSRQFGFPPRTVSKIVQGKTYADVTSAEPPTRKPNPARFIKAAREIASVTRKTTLVVPAGRGFDIVTEEHARDEELRAAIHWVYPYSRETAELP